MRVITLAGVGDAALEAVTVYADDWSLGLTDDQVACVEGNLGEEFRSGGGSLDEVDIPFFLLEFTVPPTRSLPDSAPRTSSTCSRVRTGRRRRTMRSPWQRSTRVDSTAPPSSAADLQVVRSSRRLIPVGHHRVHTLLSCV